MAKRQYPSFYEKAIPVALTIIGLLVVILLVIIATVLVGNL